MVLDQISRSHGCYRKPHGFPAFLAIKNPHFLAYHLEHERPVFIYRDSLFLNNHSIQELPKIAEITDIIRERDNLLKCFQSQVFIPTILVLIEIVDGGRWRIKNLQEKRSPFVSVFVFLEKNLNQKQKSHGFGLNLQDFWRKELKSPGFALSQVGRSGVQETSNQAFEAVFFLLLILKLYFFTVKSHGIALALILKQFLFILAQCTSSFVPLFRFCHELAHPTCKLRFSDGSRKI